MPPAMWDTRLAAQRVAAGSRWPRVTARGGATEGRDERWAAAVERYDFAGSVHLGVYSKAGRLLQGTGQLLWRGLRRREKNDA